MNMDANRIIGKSLRSMRLDTGLTQTQVAEKMQKPQSYVAKVEMGERSLHLYELFAYAQALGSSPQKIVSDIAKKLAP